MEIPGLNYARTPRHHFASDNNSPAHPAIVRAVLEANRGHALAYGFDYFTDRAGRTLKRVFGRQSEAFFVYTGTPYLFYVFDEKTAEVRLVANYDTTEADVKGFIAATRAAMKSRP